jgi:hypothetical protein
LQFFGPAFYGRSRHLSSHRNASDETGSKPGAYGLYRHPGGTKELMYVRSLTRLKYAASRDDFLSMADSEEKNRGTMPLREAPLGG